MYSTYILFSHSLNKFYTGQTADLLRRVDEHNRGKTPFLASGIPWVLVYSVNLNSRSEALILEKKIKKRGANRFLIDLKINIG